MTSLTDKESCKSTTLLDKLAQPRKISEKPANSTKGKGFENSSNLEPSWENTFLKRARSKYITVGITNQLRKIDSTLHMSYVNTFFCTSVLQQTGQKITSKYCNNRWCMVCNRIRTAKLISGYKEPLNSLSDKQFVTLTIPNVPEDELHQVIRDLTRNFISIKDTFRNRKTPIIIMGIRKLEVTYNPKRRDFHPHLHLVIERDQVARDIVTEWLKRYPAATDKAQDIRPADENSIMELFKYFTKIVTKGALYYEPLDTIFRSMAGLRVFQPMGVKKNVSEDIEELRSEIYKDLEEREVNWTWIETDWIDPETGECLTGYDPSDKLKKVLTGNILHYSNCPDDQLQLRGRHTRTTQDNPGSTLKWVIG